MAKFDFASGLGPVSIAETEQKRADPIFGEMEYRGSHYTVVQGIERGLWKWSASVAGVLVAGKAETRLEAVSAAQKAIDRALGQKVRPSKFPTERE